MKKRTCIFIVLLVSSVLTNAQINELDVLNIRTTSTSGIEQARNAYNKGEYITAEALLYTELEKGNFTPNDFLLFANTLNVDNKPSLAKEFYREYASQSGNKNANLLIEKIFSDNKANLVAKPLNTPYRVTNPRMYASKIYTEVGGRMMAYDQDCDGNLSNRVEVLEGITDIPFGSIAFYNGGKNAVASLIDKEKNTSSLHFFYQKKGKWKKPVKLFIDNVNNYAFPFIDEEHNTLYFSTDKPGGMGGYDIYISSFEGKTFQAPINMGDEINSAGNEINPVLTQEWLYFSSNGHVSNGGYDIFKYKNLGDFNTILLNFSEINSKENELNYIPVGESSFMVNKVGKDASSLDLIKKAATVSTLVGNVIDEKGAPFKDAYVLIAGTGDQGSYALTDVTGKFIYRSEVELTSYAGIVIADGYVSQRFNTAKGQNPSVQLIKIKPIEIIKEVERTAPIIETYRHDPDPTISTSERIISNRINTNASNDNANSADIGLYYIIIGSTYDYTQAYDFWNKWIPKFNGAEILEYENGLYRIGFSAGANEDEAAIAYNKAKEHKKDIWILRPKS
jgi:hypothetical protein